jgi:hypothetical protein
MGALILGLAAVSISGETAQAQRVRTGVLNCDVSAGLGANVLVGGSNRTVALQPLSIQGQVGLNLALGVASLSIRPAR